MHPAKRIFQILLTVAVITTGCLAAGITFAATQTKEASFPAYGSGPIQVRFYADYLCPPCRALEPAVEPILKNLLKNKRIKLMLVDVPFHPGSSLCAKYFLYALAHKNNIDFAMHVRNLLFEATAPRKPPTKEQIEELFRRQRVAFDTVDIKPVLARYNALIKEDKKDNRYHG